MPETRQNRKIDLEAVRPKMPRNTRLKKTFTFAAATMVVVGGTYIALQTAHNMGYNDGYIQGKIDAPDCHDKDVIMADRILEQSALLANVFGGTQQLYEDPISGQFLPSFDIPSEYGPRNISEETINSIIFYTNTIKSRNKDVERASNLTGCFMSYAFSVSLSVSEFYHEVGTDLTSEIALNPKDYQHISDDVREKLFGLFPPDVLQNTI